MTKHPLIKLCSMILVLAMFIGMLPMDALAQEYKNTSISASQNRSVPADVEVVEEATEKRSEYVKQYKMSNGLFMAAVYPEPVHYEKDGSWADIDNTLQLKSGAYTNTAGIWDVSFPQQLSKNTQISIAKDGYTLSFGMAGELRQSGNLEVMSAENSRAASMNTGTAEMVEIAVNGVSQTFAVSAAQASTAQIQEVEYEQPEGTHEKMILDKLSSRLQYADVYANTNVLYDLRSHQVKESIIMEQYSSTLRGYQYYLDVGEMIPVLNDAGQILFYDAKQEEIVMVMDAPFLVDADLQFSYDVQVLLQESGTGYKLTYLLPQSWLADSSRAWPVTLDPVVMPTLSLSNVQDQTVMSKMEKEYTWGMIQAGYYSTEGITRFYLMYNELPTLSSADVIVGANVTLYKAQTSTASAPVQVHKVLTTWEHNNMHWSNKASYNETIEDSLDVRAEGAYTWNITDIVRDWYANQNTGMMFKCPASVENAGTDNFKQFYSSNWGVNRPALQIAYRNNSGLESYWDYTAHSAGRAGTGYINNYTGNLVWVRNDIGFGGNRMPVSISHVYNANDKSNNDFGMGNGWRTNFNQRVYQWSVDSSYYVWEDADGTKHYFKNASSGTYKDEDGLELTLTTTGSGNTKYCITDKNGNKSFFDTSGRLTEQRNNQATTSSITVSYSTGNLISQIKDGAGRIYTFTYPNGLLSRIEFIGTGSLPDPSYLTFAYDGNYLKSITDKDNMSSSYTYSNGLLVTATDLDANTGYKLTYTYNTITKGNHQPYRVVKVSESQNGTSGGVLNIEYAHNQTTFTDHNGNKQIMQFNDFGNTVSIQDGEGRAQHAQYALNTANESASGNAKANQMRLSSKLQNTVGNMLSDSSFESGSTWTLINSSVSQAISNAQAYHGSKSLSMTRSASGSASGIYTSFTAAANSTYTFSAYVKVNSGSAYLALYDGSATVTSETLSSSSGWTRLEVSYTNTTSSSKTVYARFMTAAAGTSYIDCAQVEKAPTASRYNLVENGDFRTTSNWSSSSGRTTLTSAAPQLSNNVYQMTGSPTSTNRISQTVNVSGSAGDTFVLAGWAKGDSAPITEGSNREFGIIATLLNASGSAVGTATARFNPDTNSSVSWQYAAVPVVATGAYTSVKIEIAYDYNVNTIYFDGIQLYKEQFGNSYTYDDKGNVTSVVDLQKKTTTYEYDTNNNLTKMLQDNQAKMTYTYDGYHNVKTATSAEGLSYSFAYDTYGNNTSVSISSGGLTMTSSATYADGNRLATTTDAAGNVTIYNYNAQTNVLESVQYPNGSGTTTTYTYDSMYRLASAAASTGTQNLSASYTYTNDLLTKITTGSTLFTYTNDLLTKITTGSTTYNFAYGNFGLRSSIKVGSTTLASYTYTDNQNKYLQKLAFGNGDSVQYVYDTYGRVTKETFEDGDTVTYKYDNDGALATITDSATGRTTTYYYDLTDRLMKYAESGSGYSHSVGYTYDDLNNLTKLVETINGTAHTTSYAYDDDNRVTSVTNGSSVKSYTYDGFGRIGSRVSKHGSTTVLTDTITYRSPSSGKTSGQVSTLKNTASGYNTTYTYTYDANGNIKTVNDGSYTTTYTYDNQNQLTREDNQRAGKSWTWTYDDAGNILNKKEYAYTTGTLGTVLSAQSYSYGNSNWGDLLTSYDGKTVSSDTIGNVLKDGIWTYTWEHGRELASMSIGTDIAIKKQPVDFTGRVGDNATFTVEASGSGLSYQWQVSTNGGSTWGNSTAGGYSTNSMWVTITESNGGRLYRCKITDSSGNVRYSEPGRIHCVPIVITTQPVDFIGSVGANATFSVTAAGTGLSYQWQVSTNGGSTWGDSTAGGYSTNSMWVTITSSNVGRLYRCKITDSSGNVTYSQPGKIRNEAVAVTTQPVDFCGVSGDRATFTIAAVGSGLSYQWQVSTNGGNTWGNSTAGGYSTNSMWVTVTDSNGGYRYRCKVTDSSGNVVYSEPGEIKLARETWTFTYDADGMRTQRASSSATYNYVYNGSQLSQMTVDGNTLYFAYDASGTPLSVTYNGTAYYYATNLQGDITAILNTSGTAVVTYTYDAWGHILSTSGSMANTLGTHNPLRYRGYVYDAETGLYYVSSRYYDPAIGRFINADSVLAGMGGSIQGYNMFAYCFNNPINMADYSGNWPQWIEDTWEAIKDFFSSDTNSTGGEFEDGIFRGSGSLTGGYSEVNGRLQVNSKDSKTNGMLGAFGKVSVGNASGKVGIGNNDVSLSFKGVGDGLTASAQAGIQYKNGAGLAAKAKAAVLSGRVTAELDLFGWQIEFGVSGDLLSVGAEAMIGVFPNEGFTAKASVGAGLFGVGFVFRVKPAQ